MRLDRRTRGPGRMIKAALPAGGRAERRATLLDLTPGAPGAGEVPPRPDGDLRCSFADLARQTADRRRRRGPALDDPSTLELITCAGAARRRAGAVRGHPPPGGGAGPAADIEVDLGRPTPSGRARSPTASPPPVGSGRRWRTPSPSVRRRAAFLEDWSPPPAGRRKGLPAPLQSSLSRSSTASERRATWLRSPPCSGAASPSGCSPRPRTSQPDRLADALRQLTAAGIVETPATRSTAAATSSGTR